MLGTVETYVATANSQTWPISRVVLALEPKMPHGRSIKGTYFSKSNKNTLQRTSLSKSKVIVLAQYYYDNTSLFFKFQVRAT